MNPDTVYVVLDEQGGLEHLRLGSYGLLTWGPEQVGPMLERTFRADPATGPWPSRGWLIDRSRRLHRFYRPSGGRFQRSWQKDLEDARKRRTWAGWDVDVAWNRDFELRALAGLPEMEPPAEPLGRWLGSSLNRRFPWRWHAEKRVLEHDLYQGSFLGSDRCSLFVSIVDPEGWLSHLALMKPSPFPAAALLAHGPTILPLLLAEAPSPLLREREIDEGLLIDMRTRELQVWTASGLPSSVARAWEGWRIQPLPSGLAGQLATLGIRPQPLLEESEGRDTPAVPQVRKGALRHPVYQTPDED